MSHKKNLFFSILAIAILFIIFEWSGRLFISWREYKKSSVDNWRIVFEEMKKRDSHIGYFFHTEEKKILTQDEFSNEYNFIDCGVDSMRFRDDGIDKNRSKKLLAVGDSFVWGFGVELDDIFTEQLENLNKDWDVLNAGISGHSPQQYTRVIKRVLKSNIHLDAVLYNFFSGNDVTYEYSFREWSKNIKKFPDLAEPNYMRNRLISHKSVQYDIARKKDLITNRQRPGFIEQFLEDWLFSFRLTRRVYRMIMGRISFKNVLDNNSHFVDPLNDSQNYYFFPEYPSIKSNGEVYVFRSNYINSVACESIAEFNTDANAEYHLNFPLAIESINEGKKLIDSVNSDFYLVYIPTKSEVYADELCYELEEPHRTEIREKMNRLHDDVMTACDSLNIKVIDLLPAFVKAAKKGKQLYYNYDNHFNKFGHEISAKIIHNFLVADIIPKEN
ncbi:MAG: SGNH/GDSL hydrolase family protein [Bacteroidetes bacterium]|nr:SGNH/GDSL hydrolase family protein [Bacteroidota bacterium]